MPVFYILVINPHSKQAELLKSFHLIPLHPEVTLIGWLQMNEFICPNGQPASSIKQCSHAPNSIISNFLLHQASLNYRVAPFAVLPLPFLDLSLFNPPHQQQEDLTQTKQNTPPPPYTESPETPAKSPELPDLTTPPLQEAHEINQPQPPLSSNEEASRPTSESPPPFSLEELLQANEATLLPKKPGLQAHNLRIWSPEAPISDPWKIRPSS